MEANWRTLSTRVAGIPVDGSAGSTSEAGGGPACHRAASVRPFEIARYADDPHTRLSLNFAIEPARPEVK